MIFRSNSRRTKLARLTLGGRKHVFYSTVNDAAICLVCYYNNLLGKPRMRVLPFMLEHDSNPTVRVPRGNTSFL